MKRTHRNLRGLTLTETVIVLGVVGLVLGGLWLAAGSVNNKRKIQDTSEIVLQIADNVKAVYDGHANATAPTLARQISMGLLPKSILNAAETDTVNAWGGTYTLYFTPTPLYGFSVGVTLPASIGVGAGREVCSTLLSRLKPTGPAQGGGPVSATPANSQRSGGGQESSPVAAYMRTTSGGWVEVTNDTVTELVARFNANIGCDTIAFYFPL